MSSYVLRQDQVGLSGTVAWVSLPTIGLGLQADPPVREWGIIVKPDLSSAALLTTRLGQTNPGGTIACTVAVDDGTVDSTELFPASRLWSAHRSRSPAHGAMRAS